MCLTHAGPRYPSIDRARCVSAHARAALIGAGFFALGRRNAPPSQSARPIFSNHPLRVTIRRSSNPVFKESGHGG